jgi:hypothetical protein
MSAEEEQTVDIMVGPNPFQCSRKWTVKRTTDEIRSKLRLRNGMIFRNGGLIMDLNATMESQGEYSFLMFEECPDVATGSLFSFHLFLLIKEYSICSRK